MKHYTAQTFDIPAIEGISDSQIEEHLKLYNGYVVHTNRILEQVTDWQSQDKDKHGYEAHELWRRLGFEFGGMRNHEYYFGALEKGSSRPNKKSALSTAIAKQFGSFEDYLATVKDVGTTRGSGWSMTYYDKLAGQFLVSWVDEHHLGQLSTLEPVLALDCWEHAYMVDYLPGERVKYIEAYIDAINWKIVEKLFETITS